MVTTSYKVVNTHAYEISGWKILSRLLLSHAPYIGGMNGGVQSDLDTLALKNGEQLQYFHRRIFILQQEITLSGETVYPTRPILQYINGFSKSDKIKSFIAPKMTYIITLIITMENWLYIQGVIFINFIVI